jgi:hypothetical protein
MIMILRTCDRCGKEMEPIYFSVVGCNPMNTQYNPEIMVTVMEENGKARPVDLCEECHKAIYNNIFNFHSSVEVNKNG